VSWAQRVNRVLSPALLVLALVVFLTPFVSVSCSVPAGYGSAGGGATSTYSLLTLAIGGVPSVTYSNADRGGLPPATDGRAFEDYVPSQPASALALGLAIAALVVALAVRRRREGWIAVLALLAAIAVGVAGWRIQVDLTEHIKRKLQAVATTQTGPIDLTRTGDWVRLQFGFLALLVLYVLTAAINGTMALLALRRR
jgi:xanthine/uracil permease